MSCDNPAAVSAAIEAGFGPEWATEVFDKLGEDILALATQALRQGVSKEFVIECIDVVGTDILRLIVAFMEQKFLASSAGSPDVALEEGKIGGMTDVFLQLIMDQVQKNLPLIIEKYGNQLIQSMFDALLSVLKK